MHLSRFRLRFNVRRLMVAVAITALIFGVIAKLEGERRRWVEETEEFRAKAKLYYAMSRLTTPELARICPKSGIRRGQTSPENSDFDESKAKEVRSRFEQLASQNENAIYQHWLPVETDAPK